MVHHSMVSIAEKYTKLSFNDKTKKYHGKCPFCQSESKVFCADNKNALFYCYACGKHGTKEDFEAEMGLRKYEAEPEFEEDAMIQIYETAAAFYYNALVNRKNSKAYTYITRERGLSEETISNFGIGFAPGYGKLYQYLKGRFDDESIFRSGIVKRGKNGYPYDMFGNRIMFPILNRNGRIVAFGGRCLDDDGPKYLNSAESLSFNKHKLLYGFPTAMNAAQTQDTLVICEGYMDLISLQENGIRNSAAVLGTALTENHAELIRCYYKKTCLALDSDEAGIRAAARSIPILMNAGLEVSVMNFSPAKDPDEFIRKYGKEEFQRRMRNGTDPAYFLVQASDNPIDELIHQLIKRVNEGKF